MATTQTRKATHGRTATKTRRTAQPVPRQRKTRKAAAPKGPQITTRVGPKWTYIFVDGTEVAYVRNDQVQTVLDKFEAETRVGRKWTYVYLNGDEIGYIRNDQVGTVVATLHHD